MEQVNRTPFSFIRRFLCQTFQGIFTHESCARVCILHYTPSTPSSFFLLMLIALRSRNHVSPPRAASFVPVLRLEPPGFRYVFLEACASCTLYSYLSRNFILVRVEFAHYSAKGADTRHREHQKRVVRHRQSWGSPTNATLSARPGYLLPVLLSSSSSSSSTFSCPLLTSAFLRPHQYPPFHMFLWLYIIGLSLSQLQHFYLWFSGESMPLNILHGENFMTIFTTLSVVIWFSTGTLGIFATLVHVFTMRVIIHDILSMAIIPTLSTSTLFCNLSYILLWISPRSVVKIAIRI